MNLNNFKKAYAIYETLSDKSVKQAKIELDTLENLEMDVYQLVLSLIKNSQQSSQYFDENIKEQFISQNTISWNKGDIIGDYQLLEEIGHGGMATVFKAERTSFDSQKPVAIKILRLFNQSKELKEKFKAEQVILSKLSHPNIVDYHHGQDSDNENAYLVMELIDGGEVINEYVKHQKLAKRQTIQLIIQAANALQYAHNHLIIHRDIKPSNLMITKDEVLKILDFGIAKLISNENQKNENNLIDNTEKTIMALTPSFASPEQIKNEQISTKTDIFSLAAVAVALLTHENPFPENRLLVECKNDEEHVRNLLNSHSIDQDLSNVLNQALQQFPSQRYSTMSAFKSDLQAWLDNKPVSASKDSILYRISRFARRRTALFTTSVLLIITVIAAILGLTWQNNEIKLEVQKADAVKQFMLDSFSVTNPNVSQGVDLSTKDLLRLAAEKISTDNGVDPEINFELYLSLALAHGRLGYYPEAITLLNDALLIKPHNENAIALLSQYLFTSGQIDEVKNLLSQIDEKNLKSLKNIAAIKRVRSNFLAQAGHYDKALEVYDELKNISKSDTEIIHNQALLAEIYYLKGESNRSIEIIESLKKSYPLPNTDVFNLKLNSDLVQYHDRVGNFNEAMKLTLENINNYKKILGEEHPDLGMAYNSLSVFQRLNGKLEEAIISAETSKRIFIKRFGNSSEGLAQAYGNSGVAMFYQNKHNQAIKELTTAAEMLESIFSSDHPETMNALYNLATILNASDQPDKALPILEHMYNVEKSTLGKNHRSTLYTQRSLALTLANSGHTEKALFHANENIKLLNEHHSTQKHAISNAFSVLGRVHFMADNFDLAISATSKSLSDVTEANQNNRARSLKLIALSYQKLNLIKQADEYFQQWTEHMKSIYGETDSQYLNSLLEWAQFNQKFKDKQRAASLIIQVQKLLSEHDLKLDGIQEKINQLSLN